MRHDTVKGGTHVRAPMRRSELIRALGRVAPPSRPRADLEQVVSPPEAAAELLFSALAAGDVEGRSVLDLGSGTGRLAIGAALLGAGPVVGVDMDPDSVTAAEAAARAEGVTVEFVAGDVTTWARPADVVVMNPPFGAQRAHADRPFWDAAFRLARHSVYAFGLADSRTFIARRAVAAEAHVLSTRPVAWELPRTFPHHTRRQVALDVDLWAVRTERTP
ncbi:MAG: METTL5 family protein [Thermoplasmata archaeon]|nr:METTL5 family protein [Thermoplasmata archaeon]